VLTALRTAFLVYVRVLLCLQGLCLLIVPWLFVPHGVHGTALGPLPVLVLAVSLPGLAMIVTAVMLRRGRRRAAVAAIAIEALWAAAAAALALDALRTAVDTFQYGGSHTSFALPWRWLAVAALLLVTVAGLLVRPVRAYSGLVRR
jgi:hypothetical protein